MLFLYISLKRANYDTAQRQRDACKQCTCAVWDFCPCSPAHMHTFKALVDTSIPTDHLTLPVA